MRRRSHLALILTAALAAAPGISRAESVAGSPDKVAALDADRQKLRAELDRVNAEIDALKRETRGLRDDYRLRARMADAEALARRLTELDARLGSANRGPTGRPSAAWPTAPRATPSDDPVDLEAKADILSDQSRRLTNQADVLTKRVDDLRGRQELRRRAGQLEHDPFSPLEQVKRRIASAPATGQSIPGGAKVNTGSNDSATPGNPTAGTGLGSPTQTTAPGVTGGASPTPGAVATTSPTSTRVADSTGGSATTPARIPIGSASDTDGANSVASQFRGILDATTLAEIRRLEAPGSPSGNLQAMERALSVLRARASELEATAVSLRKRARNPR